MNNDMNNDQYPKVWGGTCKEGNVSELINAWIHEREMPYRLWDLVSGMRFEKDSLLAPGEIDQFERGRLFGDDGDLSIRRDGASFRWWFVGPKEAKLPAGLSEEKLPDGVTCEYFWKSNPSASFNMEEGHYLLWGEQVKAEPGSDDEGNVTLRSFFDNRVGAARLQYPVDKGWKRAQLISRTFSRAGRVEFTWFLGLVELKSD